MVTCAKCGGKVIKDENEYICNDCGRVISFTTPPVYEDVGGDVI